MSVRSLVENSGLYYKYVTNVKGIEIFIKRDSSVACCFLGRRQKSDWHLSFQSNLSMLLYIDNSIQRQYTKNYQKEKIKENNKRLQEEARLMIKPGDIFYISYGFDNKFVDFFEVIRRKSNSRVVIRKIDQLLEKINDNRCTVQPIPGKYIDEERAVYINKYGNLTNANGRYYYATKLSANDVKIPIYLGY